MSDMYSFYQLISKYQIEIPIIQRDYAQGRNNPKAMDVRKSLVDNMIKAVKEGKPLFFDFVYGRVDSNKFIPFDGQQRLTTLFLFHKYVFEKCQSDSDCSHKGNCVCRGILNRFSYATRQSSREFCESLVLHNIISDSSLTDNIKNESWFYPDWEKDPTIMGMLTMLDEIHCQMKNETDFKAFAEKLTSGCNCPITFHFVNMGSHKMSDETYVKMNARGKMLTPFENFKASLEQYLEEKKESDLLNRWKGNYDESKGVYTGIDGIWLDLFWKVANQGKESTKELPDVMIMSFFNRHFMNVWRCWYAKNTKSGKERNSLNDEKNEQDEYDAFNKRIQEEMPLYPSKDDFVSFDIYQYIMDKCDKDSCLTSIFKIFDALSAPNNTIENDCQAVWDRNSNEIKWSIFKGYINNQNRETYPSRIAFYATIKYFQFKNEKYSVMTSLSQWMRIVWNIMENSTIDSPDTYQAALRLINKLSGKSYDIYDALANHFVDFKLGPQYHAQEQVWEEIAKATQILLNEKDAQRGFSEESIINAERHPLLKGTISALFENDNCEKVSFGQSLQERTNLLEDLWQPNDNNNYNLVKVLISLYDKEKPDENFPLIRTMDNWKVLVTKRLKDCFRKNEDNSINECTGWKKMLSCSELIENSRNDNSNKSLGIYGDKVVLWGTKGCTWKAYGNVILDNLHNNSWLANLVDTNLIESKNKVENCDFFAGGDIALKYQGRFFINYAENNTICLMNENWDGKKLKNPEGDKDDTNNHFYFLVHSKENKDTFLKKLACLIAQAYPDTDKSVCENCLEHDCEQSTEQ